MAGTVSREVRSRSPARDCIPLILTLRFAVIRIALPPVLTLGLLTAAACAGEPNATASASDAGCVPASEVTAAIDHPGVTLAIATEDDRFVPSCVTLDSPGDVTLVVRNAGTHPHDITVPGQGGALIDRGQVAFVDVSVGDDGLTFTCELHPGMAGRLEVRPADAP